MIQLSFTHVPVNIPPNGVTTPDAWLTAVRVKDPVTGIERTNDPKILQIPRAIISWVASKDLPFAEITSLLNSLLERVVSTFVFWRQYVKKEEIQTPKKRAEKNMNESLVSMNVANGFTNCVHSRLFAWFEFRFVQTKIAMLLYWKKKIIIVKLHVLNVETRCFEWKICCRAFTLQNCTRAIAE